MIKMRPGRSAKQAPTFWVGEGNHQMARIVLLPLLVVAFVSEPGAASRSGAGAGHEQQLCRVLSGNEYTYEKYRGYFRTLDSSQSEKPALHSAPTASSPRILDLTKDGIAVSEGIAALSDGTTWLQVVIDQQEGWVQISNLRHTQPETFPGTNLPVAGFGGGYDPLWAFIWDRSTARFSTFPGREELSIGLATVTSSGDAANFSAANQNMTVEAVFDGHFCEPAPELGLVGLSGMVVVTSGGQHRVLAGCFQPSAQAFVK